MKEFERFSKIFPNSSYVLIAPYDTEYWKDKVYTSSLDHKAALNRWKSNPMSYEDACAKIEEGYRIGWVVPKNYVVIDVDNGDNEKSSDKLKNILTTFEADFSYFNTSRGIHFVFADESGKIKTDSHLSSGLNIEIDTRANESGYIILPINDPNRSWGRISEHHEDLPYFLKPIKNKSEIPSFIDVVEGEGRNSTLYKWRMILEKNGFSANEVDKTIRTINEYLFKDSLSNTELCKTVLREMETKDEEKPQNNPLEELAETILKTRDIVAYYSQLYVFNGTYYEPIREVDMERIIHTEYNKALSRAQRTEVISFLQVKCQVKMEDFNKEWYKIACSNGIINLYDASLETPNKTDINTIYIPTAYNQDEDLYSPIVDDFMKHLCNGDPIKIKFIYQIIGCCLLKFPYFQKFVIFYGEGGTGKSTLMNLIRKVIGNQNCASVPLDKFDKDYYTASLAEKLVSIDDDVGGKPLEYTGNLKSIVAGETISVRQIYKEVEELRAFCTLLFCCNHLPRIMDSSEGLYRRMILIELNNKIETPDANLINKMTEMDCQYVLVRAVKEISEALHTNHLAISQSTQQLLKQFKRKQSPFNQWIYDQDLHLGDFQKKGCAIMYSQFKAWCEQNGYGKVPTSANFKEEVCIGYDMEVEMLVDEVNGGIPKMSFLKRGDNIDMEFKPL